MDFSVAQVLDNLEYGIENTLNGVTIVDCLLTAVEESVDSHFIEDKITVRFNDYRPVDKDVDHSDKSLTVEWQVPRKYQHIESEDFKGRFDKIRLEFNLSITPKFFQDGMTHAQTLITLESIKCIDIDFHLIEGNTTIDAHYKAWKEDMEEDIMTHEHEYLLDFRVINNLAKVIRKYINDKDIYIASYQPEFII